MKLLTLIVFFCLLSFQSAAQIGTINNGKNSPEFTEAIKNFPTEQKNLRQWDSPVIADLDQDGWPDLILNDHGFAIRVMWNNEGKYSKPYDLIMGDMHGVSVGDFDQDGELEIILSRGGGSGANARNSKIFRVNKKREFTTVPDFPEPLAFMRGRTVKFVDLDKDGDLDLVNFAFPSKELKGKPENYLYKNNEQQQLVLAGNLPAIKGDGQKTLVTDFNQDASPDFIIYGHGAVKAYQNTGDFIFKDVSKSVLPEQYTDVTGVAELDFDNDGDFDLYLTRGKEFVAGETFYDPVSQLFGFYNKRGMSDFSALKMADIFELVNFQSQWPNKLIYVGESAYEYQYDGETHSGRDIRIVNSDALGFPDATPKKGLYLGYIGNRQWKLLSNIWAPMSGVIKGVEYYPQQKHHQGLTNVLLENHKGVYKDITKKSGLSFKDHSQAVTVADLDNNGWSDLIVVRRGNLISENQSEIYLNYAEQGFKKLNQHKVVTSELGAIGMGVGSVDYDLDGKIDLVVGNERGKWHLYKNSGNNSNNYVQLDVGTSPSNKATALGALVKLKACGVVQSQVIGSSGAQYSLNHNSKVHFGLGSCKKEPTVTVTWSNGETKSQSLVINKANSLTK